MNAWKIRHEGSAVTSSDLTFDQVMQGLLDSKIHPSDEVMGPADTAWRPIEDHPAFSEVAADLEPEPERKIDEETRLDMNALIDVSLVLLIFFILTTSYATLQKVIEAAEVAADAKAGGVQVVNQDKVDSTMIHVKVTYSKDRKSTIFLEKNEVNPDNFLQELKRAVGSSKKHILLLEHDDDVPHGVIVTVQDRARSAGIDKISLLMPSSP